MVRNAFLNHPEVEAFLFVSKGKLYPLNLPKMIQEFEDDKHEITTKLYGVLGHSIHQYSPMSFTNKEILENFWTFMN